MVSVRSFVGVASAVSLAALTITTVAETASLPPGQASAVPLRVHPHEGPSGTRPNATTENYGSLTGSELTYSNKGHVGASSIQFLGTSAAYFDEKFSNGTTSGALVWSAPVQIPSLPPAKIYNKFLLARAGTKALGSVDVAPSGRVAVRNGTGKVLATSTVALKASTWYLVEAMFSSGIVRVRLFSSTGELLSDLGPVSTVVGVPNALRTGLRSASGPMLIDRVSIGDSWITSTTPSSTPPPPTTDLTTPPPPTTDLTTAPPPTTDLTTAPPPTTDLTTAPPPTTDLTTAPPTTSTGLPTDPTIVAAGDIACVSGSTPTSQSCHHAETANLLGGADLVLTLGDNQYSAGAFDQFVAPGAYKDTWGLHVSKTRPVPGNHEYNTLNAEGYFDYFGAVAGAPGKGYYSYDLGAWHLIALNTGSPLAVGTDEGTEQERWLREDLASHSNQCVLAYWHHPRFSAGNYSPGLKNHTTAFWEDLYAAGADVVLNGHDHAYQRFDLQTPTGNLDRQRGIREFVVGTGGKSLYAITNPSLANLEVWDDTKFGVLKMTLHAGSYTWAFVDDRGMTIDDGTAPCV